MPHLITSRDNNKIKAVCKLRDSVAFRREENSFVAEGLKLCRDLCEALKLKELYITETALKELPTAEALCEECYIIAPHVAEKLASVREHQGVFCVFEMPADAQITTGRWLMLESVQDPGNVGAALRSAAAFGFNGAVLAADCADPFSQKVLRASMGASARISLVYGISAESAIAQMKLAGNIVLAAELQNSLPLNSIEKQTNVCIVIGSEGKGLTEQTAALCDKSVRIPISGMVESLNAAVAAGVLMWHFREEGV